ncbi:hypothetical protein [Azospirillum brasilense]|uniref:hypothetical protein n=1 Tax=Azospirillum brasilense TaxID=192 RepID=UPI000686DEB5|nr:hypothetical protein [Azospirillum brasilense]
MGADLLDRGGELCGRGLKLRRGAADVVDDDAHLRFEAAGQREHRRALLRLGPGLRLLGLALHRAAVEEVALEHVRGGGDRADFILAVGAVHLGVQLAVGQPTQAGDDGGHRADDAELRHEPAQQQPDENADRGRRDELDGPPLRQLGGVVGQPCRLVVGVGGVFDAQILELPRGDGTVLDRRENVLMESDGALRVDLTGDSQSLFQLSLVERQRRFEVCQQALLLGVGGFLDPREVRGQRFAARRDGGQDLRQVGRVGGKAVFVAEQFSHQAIQPRADPHVIAGSLDLVGGAAQRVQSGD